MDFQYRGFTNPDNQRAVAQAIESWKHILPHWVETVFASHKSYTHDDRCPIEIRVSDPYRTLQISVFLDFYDEPVDVQSEFLRHELSHTFINPMFSLLMDLVITPLKEKNKPMYDVMEKVFRDCCERQTEDLSIVFGRLLKGKIDAR